MLRERALDGNAQEMGSGYMRVEAQEDQEGLLIQLRPLAPLLIELAQAPSEPVSWRILDESGYFMDQGDLRSEGAVRLYFPAGKYRLEAEVAVGQQVTRTIHLGSEEVRVTL